MILGKKFRIQVYCYGTPNNWADKLYMKSYTDLDNPTGIYVNSGDELIVMVGETYGNTILVYKRFDPPIWWRQIHVE